VIVMLVGAAVTLLPESGGQRLLFVGALVLSLVGDVALLAPSRGFTAGLAAFLVAHLLYAGGLLAEPGAPALPLIEIVAVLAAGALVGTRIVRGARKARGPLLAGGVIAYLVAISGTVIAAGMSGDQVARVGAMALYASDGILGWNRFVDPIRQARLLTRVPYHAGQALMVISLVG
jgi:alkenylglycerophosphocholine hydrolase